MRDKRAEEITIRFIERLGIESGLIYGKYAGIGRVLDTHYIDEPGPYGPFDPDNPTGYLTGQCIDVQVIEGVMHRIKPFYAGDIVKGVCSYGGDVGVAGKPQIGDIVGFYLGYYAEIWEKVEVSSHLVSSIESDSEIASLREEKVPSSLINMELYKQASNLEVSNPGKAFRIYDKLADENAKFCLDIFLLGIIGFVVGFFVALFGGESIGIEKDSLLLPLIWYTVGFTIVLLRWAPRASRWVIGARIVFMPIMAILLAGVKLIEVALAFVIITLVAVIPMYLVYAVWSVGHYFISGEPFIWLWTLPTAASPLEWAIFALFFTASFSFLAVFDVSLPKTISIKLLFRVMRLKKRESLSTIILLLSILSFLFGWHSYNVFYSGLIEGAVLSIIAGGLIGFALSRIEKDYLLTNLYRLAKVRCLIRMNRDFETYFPLRYAYEDRKIVEPGAEYATEQPLLGLLYATIIITDNRELKKRRTLFKWAPWGVYIGSHEFHGVVHLRNEPASHQQFMDFTNQARRLTEDRKYDAYGEIIADGIEKTEKLWLLA